MKTQFWNKWIERDIEQLLVGVARYTRFVAFSKFSLAILAGILVLILIIVPLLAPEEHGMRIVFSQATEVEASRADAPKMLNPHFQGVDKKNQPYTVTAEYAMQLDKETVRMHRLNADIRLENDSWMSVSADEGVMGMGNKMLSLQGMVHAFYGDGYEMQTEAIDIDINNKSAVSTTQVAGQGALGSLQAAGFTITPGGETIVFNGPVNMTLYMKAKQP